ncbi:three-helix bundle dimerization domain-containing protein [Nocardia asiatica]|uniref:three-helix bundle dimerization domain-containing protein n=1 Tax=Nocardia asiatica TaxID=209252 RepID=UPI002458E7EA|nr:hypothetical protein [Nocardia asiatica]
MQNDEASQIRYVVRRLVQCHPEVPPEAVALVVRRTHERFGRASVREFVPLLVERRAGRELSATSGWDEPTVQNEADRAQAEVFFDLLVAEADELDSFIEAMTRTGSSSPADRATELRRLRTELHEVLRCITQLRHRFPGVAPDGSLPPRELAHRSASPSGNDPVPVSQ